jgi:hypothetical protein
MYHCVSQENNLNDGSKKLIPGHNRMIFYIYINLFAQKRMYTINQFHEEKLGRGSSGETS